MAWTNMLSVLSCTAPDLPGLVNSRVMVNTLGIGELPWGLSWAATMQPEVTATDTANRVRLNLFMDANLLACGRDVTCLGLSKGGVRRTLLPGSLCDARVGVEVAPALRPVY